MIPLTFLSIKIIKNNTPRKKIIVFLFGGYKITTYLCNCQTSCSNTQIRARRISSPELIKLQWAYFMPILADLCNEDMADAFQ